jgi:hypothetical protein
VAALCKWSEVSSQVFELVAQSYPVICTKPKAKYCVFPDLRHDMLQHPRLCLIQAVLASLSPTVEQLRTYESEHRNSRDED